MTEVAALGPPRASLSFRVGIVGHRPNRLPEDAERLGQLRATLNTILRQVRITAEELAASPSSLYAPPPPVLRALSPLAEGSDRIFAEEALALDYELCCPMPFSQEEFEKDFAPGAALEPDSLTRFRALLARANAGSGLTLFEIEGNRDDPGVYGEAGRIVLNQSDLLIAVWDGGKAAGPGGTVETMREALDYHVPVIWIDAKAPNAWRLLHTLEDLSGKPDPSKTAEQLHEAVSTIVRAELNVPAQGKHDGAGDYFSEIRPRINLAFVWKAFRDVMTGSFRTRWTLFPADFENQVKAEWPVAGDGGATPSQVSGWINSRLRRHYAWADGLADFYADAHRSAFVLAYLLTAAAVFVALLPMAMGGNRWFELACTIAELCFLVSVAWLLWWGRWRRWHDRWTEYRLLAELIRQLRFLVPLGGGKPLPRMPDHMAVYGDPARTWMYWHVRAIAREIGIPGARVGQSYLHDCLGFLAQTVGNEKSGQWGFHCVTERRSHRLSDNLHYAVLILLGLTIAGVTYRLSLHFTESGTMPETVPNWLVLLAASLPALGAALEGISNQGEFIRVAKRSKAMTGHFGKYAEKIVALDLKPSLQLAELVRLSGRIAQTMVDEVVDWRAVITDRE